MSSIESYIQKKVVILHKDATARQASRAMCERNVGCVLVGDVQGELVGIVTDRDLACSLATELEGVETHLAEVMTARPVSVDQSDDLSRVIHVMEESGIRRVPVVKQKPNGGSHCVGIITLDDLIASKKIDYDHLAQIVRSQMRKKAGRRLGGMTEMQNESRTEAHAEQTLNRFYKKISEHIEIPRVALPKVTQTLLGCLIRRMHYTGATKFVAQLPIALQEDLLDLPAGPDRRIDKAYMARELSSRFGFSDTNSDSVLHGFFRGLTDAVNPEEIENIMAQLPEELRELFRTDTASRQSKPAA